MGENIEKQLKKKENKGKLKNYIIICLIIILVVVTIIYNLNNGNILLDEIEIDETEITHDINKKMLQVSKLKEENQDVVGWIEIENTKINFPVLQTTDNDYYMTHNYKKEYSSDGSIFVDMDYNWEKPSSNLLIYGHNNKNGNMFEDLLKYEDEDYYQNHKIIQFITTDEECKYEIMAVFKSKVYEKEDKDVFKYYFFIDAKDEGDYNNYVLQCKKASLYDTGVTAEYGDQLMTLSTCEYTQENGRFVVVAKKVN